MNLLVFNDAVIHDMLNDPYGPVGQLVGELSQRGVTVARSVVHVRDPNTKDRRKRAGRNSTARPPGFTKASIHVHGPVVGSRGGLYGGGNSAADPTVFLEDPASQMYQKYPFMTTGLDSLEI